MTPAKARSMSMDTPRGPLKLAAAGSPSVDPETPVPAQVETEPSGAIFRMTLLPMSDKHRVPSEERNLGFPGRKLMTKGKVLVAIW